MKRSRVALVAGLAVAGVVIVRRRRRPRAPISPMIPWLAYVAVNAAPRQGIDLSFGTVFNSIAGFFGGVIMTLIGDIVAPIAHAITYAWTVAENWISQLWQELWSAIGLVPGVFSSVAAFAEQLYENVRDYALFLYNAAEGDIANLVGRVQGIADGVLSDIWGAVWDVLTSAIAVGGGLYEWVWNTFIKPIYDYLAAQFGDFAGFVSQIVSDVINQALDFGGWLYNAIASIVGDLLDVALAGWRDLLAAVEGAYHFLLWIATHPISWVETQLEQLIDGGIEGLLDRLVSHIESSEPSFDSFVDRWF